MRINSVSGKISEDMSRLLINGVLIMQARDVMVSPVITVGKIATVRDVATVLLENRISGVPVASGDQRKAIRVLAEAIPGVTMVNDHLADSSTIVY